MFRLFSFAIIGVILIHTIENVIAEQTITGKVTHIGSSTLDKGLKVEVELRDVSLMDAPSKLIASTTITDAKSFPISYKIKYNPSDIKPHHTYSVSARISAAGDKLKYVNDVRTPAELTKTPSPTINIAVISVGGSPSPSPTITKPGDKKCAPVKCPGKPKVCPYGYQKTKDGCDICKCSDPCNPGGKSVLCGAGQRCFVEKKLDGTFGTRCGEGSSTKGKGGKGDKDGKSSKKADCNLPKAVGICKALLPRFYYNSATKSCEKFNFGGCQGNGNNFQTKAQCEALCKA